MIKFTCIDARPYPARPGWLELAFTVTPTWTVQSVGSVVRVLVETDRVFTVGRTYRADLIESE